MDEMKKCPVCGANGWEWTDFHGVAACTTCGTESAMLLTCANYRPEKGPLPQSTLKDEWLPEYRRWWLESKGTCTFTEWLEAGKAVPTDLAARRRKKKEDASMAMLDRPIILVKDAVFGVAGTWGVLLCWKAEAEKRSSVLGESKDKAQALAMAHACASAFKHALPEKDRRNVSVVTKLGQTLREWLIADDFWACHPVLSVTLSQDGEVAAGLHDTFSHRMCVEGAGGPHADGATIKDAVEALVDLIRGRWISFHGYHSGGFLVPSDLVAGEDGVELEMKAVGRSGKQGNAT